MAAFSKRHPFNSLPSFGCGLDGGYFSSFAPEVAVPRLEVNHYSPTLLNSAPSRRF